MKLTEWQTKVRTQLQHSAHWLRQATPGMAYGALATCTLLPLVPLVMSQPQPTTAAAQVIGDIFGGIGLNLVTQQLLAWFGKSDEDLAKLLGQKAAAEPEWRKAFDELIKEFETPKLAQAVLSEADWDRFAQLLRQDVAQLGSNLVISGDWVEGDKVAGDKVDGDKVFGPKVAGDYIDQRTIAAPDPEQRSWRRYLQMLRNQCSALPLLALGDDTATSRIKLDDLYIDLDTTAAVTTARSAPFHASTTQETPAAESTEAEPLFRSLKGEAEVLSAMQAAKEHPWLVLLGAPGSGKSTFVRELLVRVIDTQLYDGPAVEGWSTHLFPLLTILRDLAPRLSQIQPALSGLSTEQRTQKLVASMREQWLEDLKRAEGQGLEERLDDALAQGEVILVLDGLDEMRAEERLYVRQAVMAVLDQYHLQHIIVTCRTYSYVGTAKLPEFTDFTLAPFDPEKIKQFVEGWYQAQALHGQMSQQEAATMTADLQQAALRVGLETMAQNPMLLTTMAIIHHKQARLPDERVRLYHEAVTIFINRWQAHKGVEVSTKLRDLLNDPRRRIYQILYEIAHKAHEQGGEAEADLAFGDLISLLNDRLDLDLASELLAYIDQRAGLLIGRGGPEGQTYAQQYAFAHRTFQEYLAGCYLLDDRGLNTALIDNFWEKAKAGDYWRQAVILGAEELFYNRSNTGLLLELIYELSPKKRGNAKADWRRILWSGLFATLFDPQEIETHHDRSKAPIGKNYLRRQRERLVQLLEKECLPALERAEAGRVLAKLGDPRPEVTTLDAMEFCFIPAGPFIMGSKKGNGPGEDPLAHDKEVPQHTYDINHAYWLARYPLTNAQYDRFVQVGGYANPAYWTEAAAHGYWQDGAFKGNYDDETRTQPMTYGDPFHFPNHPVVGISWYEALAYTRWLTAQLPQGWQARLPSEAEWEKGARGGLQIPQAAVVLPLREITEAGRRAEAELVEAEAASASRPGGPRSASAPLIPNPTPIRRYAWGDQIDPEKLNYSETNIGSTSAVGTFPGSVSPYGVEEMNGNVLEWCSTQSQRDYTDYQQKATDAPDAEARWIARGGSFGYPVQGSRSAFRSHSFLPTDRASDIGVRLVLSPSPLVSVPPPSGI